MAGGPLESAFRDFVSAAILVCGGFRAGHPGSAPTPESHQSLSEAVESATEFQTLVMAALRLMPDLRDRSDGDLADLLNRYRRGGSLGGQWRDIMHVGEIQTAVRAFLRRSGLYLELWRDAAPDALGMARRLESALAEEESPLTTLVPLDGLSIRGDEEIDLGEVRLVKLSKERWERFFETNLFYRAPLALEELADLWSIRSEGKHDGWDWGVAWDLVPPRTRVMRTFGKWIHFINLWELGSVRPVALFEKIESLLALHPVRQSTIVEPAREPMALAHEDDEVGYRAVTTVEAGNAATLRAFLLALAAGHQAAQGDGRVDTALRFFDRACDDLFAVQQWEITHQEYEVLEDFVADSTTCLEAALLDGIQNRDKSGPLGERTAALVAAGEPDLTTVQEEIRSAYGVRNAIVHGDARQPIQTLVVAAKSLRVRTRQVLFALLMLNGNRAAFQRAVANTVAKAVLRAHLREYRDRPPWG